MHPSRTTERVAKYAVLAVLVAAGCWTALRSYRVSAAPFPALLNLAPGDSNFIAYIDLAALRATPLAQQLTAAAQASQDPEYTNFVNATGFDYQKDLDHVLITSRPGAGGPRNLVIAEGRFNRDKVEEYAGRSGQLVQQNGRSVYVVPNASGKTVQFTFLSAGRVAMADGADISAVMYSDEPAMLNPAMRDRISRVAGSPIFAEVNAAEFASRANSSGAGQFAGPFQALRWIGVAAQPDGESVILSAEGETDQPAQAQQLASTLEVFRGIMRGAMSDPQKSGQIPAESAAAFQKLLDGIKITTETSRVRLLVTLTPEMMRTRIAPGSPAH
jgi:hypothetical protein